MHATFRGVLAVFPFDVVVILYSDSETSMLLRDEYFVVLIRLGGGYVHCHYCTDSNHHGGIASHH